MKFWNKQKEVRKRCWYKITSHTSMSYEQRKRQIQQLPSDGKFYMYFGTNTIWFERHEDAMLYTLKYL